MQLFLKLLYLDAKKNTAVQLYFKAVVLLFVDVKRNSRAAALHTDTVTGTPQR